MVYWKANAIIIVFVCVRAHAMNTDFTLKIMNEKAEDGALVQIFRAKA